MIEEIELNFKMPVRDGDNMKEEQVFLLVNNDSRHSRYIINFTTGIIQKVIPEREEV